MSKESRACVRHRIAPVLIFCSCRCIEVYQAPSLKLLCSIQQHHKIINVLRWHHEHSSPPQLHGLLASGSSNAIVYVHDLRSIVGEGDASERACFYPAHLRGMPPPRSDPSLTFS